MCFSFEVSLATGIFSWGAGFYLLNNRNLSISQKHDVIFLLLFSSMQFIDAILWYIKMEKNWVNFILTSFFIPLILIAQAVYNIYYRNNISHPLIDIVFIAGIIYLFRKFHGYSSSMECNRLSSPVWGSNELSIWEIMLYATFIFYPRLYMIPVIPLVMLITKGAFGSMWCAIANIFAIKFLLTF
mgnify:CR=1 FL=1|jgi:hypothetical protein